MRTLPIVLVALVLAIGAACASARTQRRSTTISAAEGSAGGAEPAQIVDLDGGVVVGPPDAGVAPLPLPDAGGAVPLVAP